MVYSQVNERMGSNTSLHSFNLLFYKTGAQGFCTLDRRTALNQGNNY
jgi:hypothetical protein